MQSLGSPCGTCSSPLYHFGVQRMGHLVNGQSIGNLGGHVQWTCLVNRKIMAAKSSRSATPQACAMTGLQLPAHSLIKAG